MTLYRNKYRVESTRFKKWDYRSPGWYFVTICTKDRACLFGTIENGKSLLSEIGQIAEAQLQDLPKHYANVLLDAFIVMPNHIHTIIIIDGKHQHTPHLPVPKAQPVEERGLAARPKAGSLSAIIRSYKAGVARLCSRDGYRPLVWQAGFHDKILRSNAMVDAVREYIWNNPENWEEDEHYR